MGLFSFLAALLALIKSIVDYFTKAKDCKVDKKDV